MNQGKKIFSIAVFMLIALGLGFFLVQNYGSHKMLRKLASSPEATEDYDFSKLKNAPFDLTDLKDLDLIYRMKYRFIEGATAKVAKDHAQLQFGNMKINNLSGSTKVFCEEFKELEFSFEATGILIAGEAPRVTLKFPCPSSNEDDHLAPISLSKSQLLEALDPEDRSAAVQWDLVEINFYTAQQADTFTILAPEIYHILGQSLRLDFDKSEN